ncbi:hypothetical protein [Mycobacteroides abscessus]|uniref:hypothetical protein n=1 Tax=Mycobacteroides abscessus TaxID=36809 RepID=UPI0009A81701|nr:hypothetical protein [Mycobacteroides abscessus]RIT69247.1 hypothetical protein D2E87_01475 [Mycobacteroides abscessus]
MEIADDMPLTQMFRDFDLRIGGFAGYEPELSIERENIALNRHAVISLEERVAKLERRLRAIGLDLGDGA